MHHNHLLFIMPTYVSSPSSATSKPPNSAAVSSTTTTTSSSSSSFSSCSSALSCKHSPSATLDLLILILVLFSGTFLLTSYLSYIFHSLSLLLSHSSISLPPSLSLYLPSAAYLLGFLSLFLLSLLAAEFCCGTRSRKCRKPGCKGLKKAMEFDLQLQTEDCVKSSAAKEIDKLPWKGGTEANPDYECLRAELRKMAPPNGRAVLLFRARCGCPIAKLEGWGPKKGRRHKKALANVAVNGGDHR